MRVRLDDAVFINGGGVLSCVQRNSAGSENPSDVFRFLVEERIQCCQTRRVRYTQRVDYCIQLPAPIEAATNRGTEAHIHKPLTHTSVVCWAQTEPPVTRIQFLSEQASRADRNAFLSSVNKKNYLEFFFFF